MSDLKETLIGKLKGLISELEKEKPIVPNTVRDVLVKVGRHWHTGWWSDDDKVWRIYRFDRSRIEVENSEIEKWIELPE
jgi:hypothetical protein